MVKNLAKIIIGLLSLWAIVFVFAEIMGVTIYFPFTIVEKQDIPYHSCLLYTSDAADE